MQAQHPEILVSEANKLVKIAKQEMDRSAEDVIAHTVCFNARQAIINYLSSYLINSGEVIQKPVTMESLLIQCRALDGRFDQVDISSIDCRHETDSEEYCLSVGKVNECLKAALQTKGIVTDEAPPY
jgi:hypothetical protein